MTTPDVGNNEGNLEALAQNVARHCEEASILAGSEVCQQLMRHASKIIRDLLARDSGSAVAPVESADAEKQHCPHCNSLKPYHDLDCPVAVAAMANAEHREPEEFTLATLKRYEVVTRQGSRMVAARDGQWVAYGEVEALVNALQVDAQGTGEHADADAAQCSINFGKGATLVPGPQKTFADGLREAARLIQL